MENKERMLAYHLATTIEDDDLRHISGGTLAQITHHQTLKLSGSSGSGADVFYDQTADW